MGIRIDIKGLRLILESTPSEQNIMLTGKHGIGKSRILSYYFAEKGLNVVSLFLGQMSDPGDLIGLPYKDDKTGKTDFMPPYWWPHDGKPIVLFLDELNRARPEVLQTVMDLTLNRKLAGKSLPQGSRIISAVNDGDEYQLTDLDPALVSRFNIYEFCPRTDEWLQWAQEEKLDNRVIDFIKQNSDMLDGEGLKHEDLGLKKTPDRRAWERVSQIISGKGELAFFYKTIIAGIVGMAAASRFFDFCSANRLLIAQDVLFGDASEVTKTLSTYNLPNFAFVNESIFRFLQAESLNDEKKKTASENLKKYFVFLEKLSTKEALAHFVKLYSDGSYKKAVLFIVEECDPLLDDIERFIRSI